MLIINPLNPTVYVIHHQFNIQELYALPTLYLSQKSDFCPIWHTLIGFYNQAEKCLVRGMDWVFK